MDFWRASERRTHPPTHRGCSNGGSQLLQVPDNKHQWGSQVMMPHWHHHYVSETASLLPPASGKVWHGHQDNVLYCKNNSVTWPCLVRSGVGLSQTEFETYTTYSWHQIQNRVGGDESAIMLEPESSNYRVNFVVFVKWSRACGFDHWNHSPSLLFLSLSFDIKRFLWNPGYSAMRQIFSTYLHLYRQQHVHEWVLRLNI